jgi:hypothetical protein
MITMTELERELKRPLVADTSLEADETYYSEIRTETEKIARAKLDEEIKAETIELGLTIYNGVREEAMEVGIEERFFLKALEEETIGGLESEIESLYNKFKKQNAKRKRLRNGGIPGIIYGSGVVAGILGGLTQGIYLAVTGDWSWYEAIPVTLIIGVGGGLIGSVASYIPAIISENLLKLKYSMEEDKKNAIDHPKYWALRKTKSTLEHELHCRSHEGLISEYIGLGKEIDYDSLLMRAIEMQTSEYETLQARHEKAERKIEVKKHLKRSMDDYLGRGFSEKELQASYRSKYGIEMSDESLPLELFTERVEDTASSIIGKRRKEKLRKITEEVVYATQ